MLRKNLRRVNARTSWKTVATWDYCLAKAVCTVKRFDFHRRCACTNKTRTFCSLFWIERLASSELIPMAGHGSKSPPTHAYPDIDAIHAAEERSLPEINIIIV